MKMSHSFSRKHGFRIAKQGGQQMLSITECLDPIQVALQTAQLSLFDFVSKPCFLLKECEDGMQGE